MKKMVQIWVAPTRPAEMDWEVLSEAERVRARRFHFERDRDAYVTARALVRRALSTVAPGAPDEWEFETNAYGRPELAGENPEKLSFNLSRKREMTACAVCEGDEVGIDIEDLDRPGETVSVAESFFAPSEVRALRALPAEQQRLRFFEYWTLKESYIKARGMGLSLPLDRFAFSFENGVIRLAVDPELEDPSSQWAFQLIRPDARHLVAICLRPGLRTMLWNYAAMKASRQKRPLAQVA
jgi:4'-phosphopantetheinyl transferase